VLVGLTRRIGVLLFAMTLFGFCTGLYDSNIFASLYDTIEPRARSTAAGIMNTIGWGGGALGPLFIGLMAGNGPRDQQIHNMSRAIAFTGAIYVAVAALLLCTAFAFAPRDCERDARPLGA
jgi:MFS family permease